MVDNIKSYCKGLVLDEPLIHEAYQNWLSGSSGHKNAKRVPEEYGSAENLIAEIEREIRDRALSFRPIRRYQHREPTNGKLRLIGIESVKQQVCDYVAVLAMKELIDAKVGFWQVASIRGKGQPMLVSACRGWLNDSRYHVHLDVRKCYPSIKTDVVTRVLRRYVKSSDVLYLCESLLSTYDGCLEIGSYFSLKMAQLVLSFGYHYLEDADKERRGKRVRLISHQGWYADDIFIFGDCKRDMEMAVRGLGCYLYSEFGLDIKPWKLAVSGCDEPCHALGNTVRPTKTTVKADLYLRIRRAYRDFERHPTLRGARRVASYWGYLKHADCHKAIEKHGYDATFRHARKMISRDARATQRKGSTNERH